MEMSTQTSCADQGTCEDVIEKVETLRSALEVAVQMRENAAVRRPPATGDKTIGCPICLTAYSHPRCTPVCLPCGHSVCKACAESCSSHSGLTCPLCYRTFDADSSRLPTNFNLLELQESINPAVDLVCAGHGKEVIGYCVREEELLCGECLFVHKDHDAVQIDSPQAEQLANAKVHTAKSQSQQMQVAIEHWEAWIYTLETLSMSLNMTPVANSLNIMLLNLIPIAMGTDEYRFMTLWNELTKLRSLNQQFLSFLQSAATLQDAHLQQLITAPVGERLRHSFPPAPTIPDTQDLLSSLSLLVHRLTYCSAQWSLGLNSGYC